VSEVVEGAIAIPENGLILAAFVTPALVGVGAAAMSAPILIHLLARRRFKRVRWAAMEFLLDADRRNRRRVRLEEWILLVLRCLAVFLIGILVARPFVSPANIASAFGGSRRTERVFLLDDTFSMGYQVESKTVFDRVKQAMRKIIASVRRQSPDDTVTILRASAVDHPVVAGAFLDDSQTDLILENIEAMQVSQRSMDLREVLDAVVKQLDREDDILNVALYILSDFQSSDWAMRGGGSGKGVTSPAAALQRWATDERSLQVFLVKLGEDQPVNTAVTELRLDAGQVVAGTTDHLYASVTHFANEPRSDVTLQLTVGDRPQSSKSISSLPQRQQVTIDYESDFIRTGDESLRVRLADDRLAVDNTRYLTATVVGAIRVLIVNGEPSADEFNDEVALLATALRPEGDVFSGMESVVVDEAGLEDMNLSQFHLVVLANVYRVVEPMMAPLEHFVRNGGGLVIYLGDQVDPELYNATMFREGKGLSPVELVEILHPSEPAHLVVTDRLHPVLRGVGGEDDPLGLGRIPFRVFFGTRPYDPQRHGEGEQSNPAKASHVLARFDDANQSPAIVERSFGAGRVVVLTSSADKEWNLWPDHPTYVPVTLELADYVAQRGRLGSQQLVGAPIELPLEASVYESDVLVRTPSYPNEPEAPITATSQGDGDGLVVRWDHTPQSGFYQFVMRRRDGEEQTRMVAVNVDARESDLTPVRQAQLRTALAGIRVEIVNGLAGLAGQTDDGRTELWRFVLICGVLVLMAEQGLAWFWGRRR